MGRWASLIVVWDRKLSSLGERILTRLNRSFKVLQAGRPGCSRTGKRQIDLTNQYPSCGGIGERPGNEAIDVFQVGEPSKDAIKLGAPQGASKETKWTASFVRLMLTFGPARKSRLMSLIQARNG